jgi:ABC-type Mn2+/Zn2+ transport system permease subunit
MNETWTKRLLLASAAWNISGGATSLADPANHFAQMYTVAPPAGDALLMYFYQCTWINVLAWGLAYALAAFWKESRPAVLLAGGIGKAVYFVACLGLVLSGVGKPLVLAFGIGDLAMAGLFGWAFWSQRRAVRSEANWAAA